MVLGRPGSSGRRAAARTWPEARVRLVAAAVRCVAGVGCSLLAELGVSDDVGSTLKARAGASTAALGIGGRRRRVRAAEHLSGSCGLQWRAGRTHGRAVAQQAAAAGWQQGSERGGAAAQRGSTQRQQAQRAGGSGAARAGVRARVAWREPRSQGERGRERRERKREKSES